jgi:hypothetical protein
MNTLNCQKGVDDQVLDGLFQKCKLLAGIQSGISGMDVVDDDKTIAFILVHCHTRDNGSLGRLTCTGRDCHKFMRDGSRIHHWQHTSGTAILILSRFYTLDKNQEHAPDIVLAYIGGRQ